MAKSVRKQKSKWRHAIEWLLSLGLLAVILYAVAVLGFRASPVMSNSMEPLVTRGDMVLYVSPTTITPQQGDVVVFTAQLNPETSIPLVHRWVETSPDGSIVTKGDNNPNRDPWVTPQSEISGVMVGRIPLHIFRNDWIIPVAGTVLAFVLISSIALSFVKNDDSDDEPAPEDASADVRRTVVYQERTAQETALSAQKRRKKVKTPPEPLDWYSGGEDWPNSPSRYPWLEPAVKVVTRPAVVEPDNTFAAIVAEVDKPTPVIPEGWVPIPVALPPDPVDIYCVDTDSLPSRPSR